MTSVAPAPRPSAAHLLATTRRCADCLEEITPGERLSAGAAGRSVVLTADRSTLEARASIQFHARGLPQGLERAVDQHGDRPRIEVLAIALP